MIKVIVVGSGSHAKVVIDILNEMPNIEIFGITSKSLKLGTIFNGHKVIGNDNVLTQYMNQKYFAAMALGGYRDNNLRESIYRYIKGLGGTFINVIHPTAIISKTVKLGESVVICPGVILNTDVQIGDNTIIATGSTIDHETIIGDHVLVSAGVTIGGNVLVKENAVIALGSKIISGIEIGKNAFVTAGSVVINNVKDNTVVFGNPARILPQKK